MQNNELKCTFFLRKSKKLVNGNSPIYLKIELSGRRKDVSTKISIPEKYWCQKSKVIKQQYFMATEQNESLYKFKEQVLQAVLKIRQSRTTLSLQNIFHHLNGGEEPHGILEFFQIRLDELESQIGTNYSKGTYINYRSAFRHLQKFCTHQLRKREVMLGDLNIGFLDGYLLYLRTEGGCQINSANKYMRALRAVLYKAKQRDLIDKNPFENYSLRYEKGKTEFLSELELKAIMAKSFSIRRIQVVRDLFIFSCFTGLAYTDIKNLRLNNIHDSNGNKFVVQKRQKSQVEAVVPILPQADAILQQYLWYAMADETELVFPAPSNQKVNSYLKEIADLCGIHKNLTFHMARHTFATTVTLANEVPIESISKMMGHTSIKTTQIYAKVLNEKLSTDMAKISNRFAC